MGMEREQDAANENIYRTSSVDLARESERKKNLILIAFAFLIAPSSARRCYSISRLTLELIRGQTHLDDGGSGDRSDALRAHVENSLKNADVASHHETACDGRIDVTATDMSESLEKEINREEK